MSGPQRQNTTIGGLAAPRDDAPRVRKAVLIALQGPSSGTAYPITGELVIGRSSDVAIVVDDDRVSRQHARLTLCGPEQVRLDDLGSRNGTWLNGARISGSTLLRDGDRIQVGGDAAFHLVFRDPLEQRVQERQKMEAIGRLAGGVAHEFNNMLAVVLGSLSQLGELLRDAPPLHLELIHDATEAVQRATDLSQQLLGLSRRGGAAREPIDVSALVADAARLVSRTLARDLEIATEVEPGLFVRGDAAELQQALLNLCINARDAMPAGGTLTLRARRRKLAGLDEAARQEGIPPGDYAELTVEDTGAGMDPATLKHVFEPFFTTKRAGKGSGLGLAIVHAVVHEHGGHVQIRSAVAAGTQVTLFLPTSQPPPTTVRKPPPTLEIVLTPAPPSAVLLVEHDPAVRRQVERMLAHLGRPVLVAESGAQALELLRAQPREVGLALLDAGLPRPGGAQLLADLRALSPALKIVVSSPRPGQADELLRAGAQAALPRPYTLQQLVETLRAL